MKTSFATSPLRLSPLFTMGPISLNVLILSMTFSSFRAAHLAITGAEKAPPIQRAMVPRKPKRKKSQPELMLSSKPYMLSMPKPLSSMVLAADMKPYTNRIRSMLFRRRNPAFFRSSVWTASLT